MPPRPMEIRQLVLPQLVLEIDRGVHVFARHKT
jgi:hypothetical protein